MASRTRNMVMQLTFDPVDGAKRLRWATFTIDDDAGPAYYEPTGHLTGNRDLTPSELAGTLEAFLSSLKTEADGLHPS